MEKRFWIGFDGFDSSARWAKPLHFATSEEAEAYRHANWKELHQHCIYCVGIYERESDYSDKSADKARKRANK
tara:strand:- start:651 stop:869 length:219 start_codon:yes stop_codon:yes gene_type:complete